MHCIILLPDAAGRLPRAEELRQRGFSVSEAVARTEPRQKPDRSLALAAEKAALYGLPHPADAMTTKS